MKALFVESGRDLNEFGISLQSGVMAAGLAAGSEILQLRWTSSTAKMLIKKITLFAANDGTAFAAGTAIFDLIKASGWTVDGTGGNAATLTTNNGNLTTNDADTLLTSLRSASTAALGAGTKTLLAHPIKSVLIGVPATAGIVLLGGVDLFEENPDERHAITLAANEGVVIRATVPATGTWKFAANIEWLETK